MVKHNNEYFIEGNLQYYHKKIRGFIRFKESDKHPIFSIPNWHPKYYTDKYIIDNIIRIGNKYKIWISLDGHYAEFHEFKICNYSKDIMDLKKLEQYIK